MTPKKLRKLAGALLRFADSIEETDTGDAAALLVNVGGHWSGRLPLEVLSFSADEKNPFFYLQAEEQSHEGEAGDRLPEVCKFCHVRAGDECQCERKPTELVIVIEGGLVQDVKQLYRSGRAIEPEHTVIDVDQLSQDPTEDVAERWGKFPEAVKVYIEKHMPDEFAGFKAALDSLRAKESDL